MIPLISKFQSNVINGEITVPGDKSISHRSLIFASLANGVSKIYNLLEGEDVVHTAEALKSMGVEIIKYENYWQVNGSGVAGLCEPANILEMGNSGTGARLLAGLVTPYNFISFFSGDSSLRKRPMARIFEPIKLFGANIVARQNNLMPFAVIGNGNALPIEYQMKTASAQVKSAILLASLATRGKTIIVEPEPCRDHTEIMMKNLGLDIKIEKFELNQKIANKISYTGLQDFQARDISIIGDISSAAFFIVATLISPNSKITIKNVGVNPLRTGIITTLLEMNANIELINRREVAGELVADIIVESSNLKGIEVPASRASSMIDEYPILSIASANATGITKMNGLAELKVKESNRLTLTQENLVNCGVDAKIEGDSLLIKGGIIQPKNQVKVKTAMDHRMAMSFLIMGLKIEKGIKIDDSSMISTSFPNFLDLCRQLSIKFEEPNK